MEHTKIYVKDDDAPLLSRETSKIEYLVNPAI
jgi:hypothetical protein